MSSLFKRLPPLERIKLVQQRLGPQYFIANRNYENVLCRKLNDDYELEISGLDTGLRALRCWIYVNYIGPEPKIPIVEVSEELKSMPEIRDFISRMEEKYLGSDK